MTIQTTKQRGQLRLVNWLAAIDAVLLTLLILAAVRHAQPLVHVLGFGALFGTSWGTCVLLALGIAIALLGIGDGVIRPGMLAGTAEGLRRAQRGAIIGVV